MGKEAVLYERQGNVGIITFNREERLNAMNPDLLRTCIKHLHTAREDERVVSVILTGAGKSFCAGEDLKETQAGKSFEAWIKDGELHQEVQRAILKLDKPLIAAVNGYAVGGGCEFAMSCDIRIAAQNAKFGFPETGVGFTVTSAGTKLLSQLVGLGKAKELIFTGDFIDAYEALRIGLVNKIFPTENLLDEALGMAKKIGEKSPLSLKLSRIAIDHGLHSSFEQTLEIEADHMLICIGAENQKKFCPKKLADMKKGKLKGVSS